MNDARATEGETKRLRALEDAVSEFAKAVGSQSPPLIGFYPAEARSLVESICEGRRIALEAVAALEQAGNAGTADIARRLLEWCDANKAPGRP